MGVRMRMLVWRAMCLTKSCRLVMLVLTDTLFSHSKSAHMERKAASLRVGVRVKRVCVCA